MARVAVLLDHGFEDAEYAVPARRLRGADHDVVIVGTKAGHTLGSRHAVTTVVDSAVADCAPEEFDAVYIPGGDSVDRLCDDEPTLAFLRAFAATGRPIAAIGHGPRLLLSADLVARRRMTSWSSARSDLEDGGALWEDSAVVTDGPFITARGSEALPELTEALLEALSAIPAGANPREHEQPPSAFEL